MLSEAARVLRSQTGRIVLLCGNYVPVVRALQTVNGNAAGGEEDDSSETDNQTIIMPLDSIFPTNIGGLLAWVVVARRGGGQSKGIPSHRDRVRKLTKKRERVEKCRAHDKKTKKRSDYQS